MGGWISREVWLDPDVDIVYEGMRTGRRMLY